MRGDFILVGGWAPWARMTTPPIITMSCRRGLNLRDDSNVPSSVLHCDNGLRGLQKVFKVKAMIFVIAPGAPQRSV